jgi:hypothetical protein
MEAVAALYTEDSKIQTVVLDSLDKLEPLLWAKVCEENNWQNMETPGYGKSYIAADSYWRDLLEGMTALRRDKNMGIVYIAHSTIDTVNDPTVASYSQFNIRLHKRAVGLMQDEVDAIFFLNQDVSLLQNDPKAKAGPGTRVRAAGGGNRWVHCTPRPAYIAKNRYGMPDKLEYKKGEGYKAMEPFFPSSAKKPAAVKAA